MGKEIVIIDLDEIEHIHREDGEVTAVTVSVVDGPYDDPHEADFQTRGKWNQHILRVDNK